MNFENSHSPFDFVSLVILQSAIACLCVVFRVTVSSVFVLHEPLPVLFHGRIAQRNTAPLQSGAVCAVQFDQTAGMRRAWDEVRTVIKNNLTSE